MVLISPVGLPAAQAANTLTELLTFKEKLCGVRLNGVVPEVTISYSYESPTLNNDTIFIPIVATIALGNVSCGCNSTMKVYKERFVVAFQGYTQLPSSVTLTKGGVLTSFNCKQNLAIINNTLTVVITVPAA